MIEFELITFHSKFTFYFVLVASFIISFSHCQINLAVISSVSTFNTCGNPPEQYFETWQGSLAPKDRIPFICNASEPDLAHPPELILDDDPDTFWQSTADQDVATLNFDLKTEKQKFSFVSGISINFGAYQRPGQIFISKSQDGGQTFLPWHYLVSFPFECQAIFGKTYITKPFSSNTVLCTTFSNFIPLSGNETVNINLKGGRDPNTGLLLQQWMNATNIRIRFSGLYKKFDKFSKRWHHYSVRDVNITGYCSCNGHASECIINATSKEQYCLCENNACGDQCQECCPGFMQFPWKTGAKAPFIVDEDSECGACNCHNHTSQCIYNQTIANGYLSLDIDERYNGGGVCIDCKDDTVGINCEECLPFYYRPSNVSRYSQYACQECNCNIFGSKKVPQAMFLDCFRLGNATSANMSTGDCYCKEYVRGRQCDLCKAEFFNLSSENENGCQGCDCYLIGTVNGSNLCQGDAKGQCPCKRNTVGRKCDGCADGAFNLSRHLNDGCQDCLCDPGGRASFICDKINGSCSCKDLSIIGRKCDSVADEYYYPTRHFINAIPIRTQIIVSWISSIDISMYDNTNGSYNVIIKYTSPLKSSGVITLKSLNDITALSSAIQINGSCSSVSCYHLVDKKFDLASEQWEMFLNFDLASSDAFLLNVENIILVPDVFLTAEILGSNATIFNEVCNLIHNDVQIGKENEDFCKQGVFSLAMGFTGRPFACNCNQNGSYGNLCDKYGGQCQCKYGVSGRKCDQCKPGYFNQTIHGCTACNCSGSNKICDDKTGQCKCPLNVIGLKCDTCQINHWHFDPVEGCKNCNCSRIGSSEAQCDNVTGTCSCKHGVQGKQCDSCVDGFYNLNANGCSECNCDVRGSVNLLCQKDTGQCVCKLNTMGRQCNECKQGAFGLSSEQEEGCINCYCSGRTNNCSRDISSLSKKLSINSAVGILPQSTSVIWSLASINDAESWVHFYGGILSVTYAIQSNSVLNTEANLSLFIKGEDTILYSNFSLDVMSTAGNKEILLTEISWIHFSTQEISTRNEFMAVLSSVTSISASYVTYTAGLSTRLGPIMLNAATSDETSSIEACQCPQGYQGMSCERCSSGFKRSSSNDDIMISECINCECNNHANVCNQYNGVCYNCSGSTFGNNCENCLDGFYGNASVAACKKCPCESPRTSSHLCTEETPGVVKCLNCTSGYEGSLCDRCSIGYYGNLTDPNATCEPCHCHGNSNTCNTVTGECINCGNNSSGFYCEHCQDNYYGNSIAKTCQACLCDLIGSISSICNKTTGQCVCRGNVEGRTCSHCKNDSYGFNNQTGCTLCNCNQFGSVHAQCNASGNCLCKQGAIGVKCDSCKPLMYGLPLTACSDCGCNLTGSLNSSCHTIFGLCHCQPGVVGRQCNQCEKQHTNFSTDGCSACPECTQLLQRKLDDMGDSYSTLLYDANRLSNLTSLDKKLGEMQPKIKLVEEQRNMFVSNLTSLSDRLERIGLSTLNDSISNISDLAICMLNKSTVLLSLSKKEFHRVLEIRENATSSTELLLAVNQTANKVLSDLQYWNRTITSNHSELSSSNIHQPSLEILNSTTHNHLDEINNLMEKMIIKQQAFENQHNEISNATESVHSFKQMLTSLENVSLALNINLTILWEKHNELLLTLNSVKATESQVEHVLKNITSHLNDTNHILQETQIHYSATKTLLDETYASINDIQSRLLKMATMELPGLKSLINSSKSYIALSQIHSENLTASAAAINVEVTNALALQLRAINAVGRYKEITMLVNHSLVMSAAANRSLGNVIEKIQQINGKNLTADAIRMMNEANDLLSTVKSSSHEIEGISLETNSSVLLYNNASNFWNNINSSYYEMEAKQSAIDQLISRNVSSTSLNSAFADVIIKSKSLTNGIDTIVTENKIANKNITLLESTVDNSNAIAETSALTLANVSGIANKIQIKLSTNSTPMDDIAKINEHVKDFNTMSKQLDDRLLVLKLKIAQIKAKAKTIKTGVNLNGHNKLKFDLTNQTRKTTNLFDELQLDFRTNQKQAVLMEATSGKDASSRLQIFDGLVMYSYQKQQINTSLTNWGIKVDDGKWKRAYATRYGSSAKLTVTDLQSDYYQTYVHQGDNNGANLELPDTTDVTIGFTEKNETNLFNFVGCIGGISINEISLQPFSASEWKEEPLYCNASTRIPSYSDIAHFGSSSYVKHHLNFDTRQNISSVTFEFRTTASNLNLFQLTDSNQTQVLSLEMKNGLIMMANQDKSLNFTSHFSLYNDNQWHRIILSFSSRNSSMSLISNYGYANTSFDIIQSNYTLAHRYHNGYLIFGPGKKENSGSSVQSFCLKSLQLDLSNSSAWLQSFDDTRTLINSHQVAFGICHEQVIPSYKFITSSKSRIDLNGTKMGSVSLLFRTKSISGTLALGVNQGFVYLIMLFHGDVIIQIMDNKSQIKKYLQTTAQSLHDGATHNVTLQFTENDFVSLHLDNMIVQNASVPGSSQSHSEHIDIGYVNDALSLYPDIDGLERGLDFNLIEISVNGISLNPYIQRFGSFITEQNIKANVTAPITPLPTFPTPTSKPPSCGLADLPIETSTIKGHIGFGYDSFMVFKPEDYQRALDFFKLSFLVTVEFRALSQNGVILYTSQSANDATQHLSLELVDGYLLYQINTGNALIKIKSAATYANGVFYKVYLLRIAQDAVLLVANTKDYQTKRHDKAIGDLKINFPFYIGGVPSTISANVLHNRNVSFIGCISQIEVSESTNAFSFDLSNQDSISSSNHIGQCYSDVVQQISFKGNGYVKLKNPFIVTNQFSIHLKFYATSRNGLLWHIKSDDNSQQLSLQQISGQLVLTQDSRSESHTLTWSDALLGQENPLNSSFLLCNTSFNTVLVSANDGNYTIKVNNQPPVVGFLGISDLLGNVFVGGSPNWLDSGLIGCISAFKINDSSFDLLQENRFNTTTGCRPLP